jgi:hypothetical protein
MHPSFRPAEFHSKIHYLNEAVNDFLTIHVAAEGLELPVLHSKRNSFISFSDKQE